MSNKLIFYIDSMQLGGAQRVMSVLTSYFVNRGNEVILITDDTPEPGDKEYDVDKKVKRFQLNATGRNFFIKNIRRILILRRYLKTQNPDSIVAFLGPPNIRLLISSLGIKTRKYVSVRNDPSKEYPGRRGLLAKALFNSCNGVIFQTNDAASFFSKSVQNKSKVIFNPVDEKFFRQNWRGEDSNEIVVIGRLEKQKNCKMAIDAFNRILKNNDSYRLSFYGEGSLKDELIEYACELGILEKISFLGSTNTVEDILKGARLFIMTSEYEGLPNALMEAMAVGVPVISTDCPCGGPRSLFGDDLKENLVSCGDVVSMSEKMEYYLQHLDASKQVSQIEKKRSQLFEPTKILEQWDKFIN